MKNHTIKSFWFAIYGVMASITWLTLLVAGLLVDSSYYRAAINYGFAKTNDWIATILTFTISNVAILAFFAGMLGGVTSKLRATEGFTLSKGELEDKKVSKIEIENPFISAFRGMFVFVGILFMQYISSYSDLGNINKNNEQTETSTETNRNQLYLKLTEQIKDLAVLEDIKRVLKSEEPSINKKDSSFVSQIFLLKDSLQSLKTLKQQNLSKKDNTKPDVKNEEIELFDNKIRSLDNKIHSLRRSLKVPSNVDFSGIGITSFSYFKFAIIVSFLAFIFGYEPYRFTEFLGRIFKNGNRNGNENNSENKRKNGK